jgi:magnesium-transporting ATPase (P-type)
MGEIFYLFNCRRLTAPILSREGFLGNPRVLQAIGVLLVLQALFTHLPLMQSLFRTADLDAATWLRVVLAGVLVLLAVETEKVFWRRRAAP